MCTRNAICWFCLFALSPPEEKKRRQVKGAGGWIGGLVVQEKEGKGRETGRNGELTEERESGGSTEEPSCDSHPTSMHRWECYKCSLVSPVTLPHFKQIQFYADFYRSHPILYSVLYSSYFFCHTLPDYNYQIPYDWCENVKLFFWFSFLFFWQWFFQQDSGHLTVHRQTYRQTQIYRADTKR